ncbi:C40 family peptidase [Alicyclobacillus dauci]|uniref:NlpC/P60 family protein n=1 Tax=Alicyclobacillus dauci TaxID=1475485 RepID=A0ABY6Z5W8_9BACL|nr:NlpC/P60 family protein [Alicyclobacillus dauci]WAH37586.1 NlpC/P60 family protein [Alicyclobacillus dauci]
MKTRYKLIGGVVGGIVVVLLVVTLIGRQYWWNAVSKQPTDASVGQQTDTTTTALANVTIVPSQPTNTQQQDKVCAAAQQILQNPGAASFDASGFVQYVYDQAGVQLPRTIAEQVQFGTIVGGASQLEKGDLVVFDLGSTPGTGTFDGIYLGNNEFAAVTTHGLMKMSLNDSYWSSKFIYGRRVL